MSVLDLDGLKVDTELLSLEGKSNIASLALLDVKIEEVENKIKLNTDAHNFSVDYIRSKLQI
jgi:hypothetical protein